MRNFWSVAMALIVATLFSAVTVSAPDSVAAPEVDHDKGIVHAAFNTQGEDGVIEGSVAFMVNVPFRTIVEHVQDKGTLGKISPQIKNYTATVKKSDEDAFVYAVEEEIAPLRTPLLEMPSTRIHLDLSINARALKKGIIAIDYGIATDKENESPWEKLSGRCYAVDLRNGWTQLMIATSTKSKYSYATDGIRLALARWALGDTRKNILRWLGAMDSAKEKGTTPAPGSDSPPEPASTRVMDVESEG